MLLICWRVAIVLQSHISMIVAGLTSHRTHEDAQTFALVLVRREPLETIIVLSNDSKLIVIIWRRTLSDSDD